MPAIVRTPRLVLRRQRPEYAAMIKEAVDASIAHLRAAVAWAQSVPEPLAVLASRLAASADAFDAGQAWAFTILDANESSVLGAIGLERAEPALAALVGAGTLEAGYWLRTTATGHGYATEATAALVDLAFTKLGAPRVAICHDPANAPSAGIPRRLGFTCVGTVSDTVLPGRQSHDGSIRPATTVWVLDAAVRPAPNET